MLEGHVHGVDEILHGESAAQDHVVHEKIRRTDKSESTGISRIPGKQRIEQCRYTLETLAKETGVGTADVQRRMMDFGMHYWQSHHPYYVPEPMTLEPTETPSKEDIDEYIETLKYVFDEAYNDPEKVKNAPYQSVCHQLDESNMDDPAQWAVTWRCYLRKFQ